MHLLNMKETQRRRIAATSSLNAKFTDQQLGERGVGVTPPALTPIYSRLLNIHLKTTLTVFLHLRYLLYATEEADDRIRLKISTEKS